MLRLLEHLNERGQAVPVAELADLAAREFGVSEVTLRSDLNALCSLAPVRKLARGSYQASTGDRDALTAGPTLFATRLQRESDAKFAIARAVVDTICSRPDLGVLLLDAGTTTYHVADLLSERGGLDLVVWTPSIAAAARLAGARGVSVRLLGGEYHPDYQVVSGDETARALRALAGADPEGEPGAPMPSFTGACCVLDVNYIDPTGGLFTDESRERLQKRLMAELAAEILVVADHTKLFGRRLGMRAHEIGSLASLAAERRVSLITDAACDAGQLESLVQLFGSQGQSRGSGASLFTFATPPGTAPSPERI